MSALFDLPEPAPRKASARSRLAHHAPVWSRYRPKNPAKCDDCMAVLVETGGRGPVAVSARWRRRAAGGDLLLCHEHANARREADRLPSLKLRGAL